MNTPSEYYNFQTVLEAVSFQIDSLVRDLFPEAKKQTGCYRIGGINGEKGTSLSISTKSSNAGVFHDFEDPTISGNAIGLWALKKGKSYIEAGNELARYLNVQPEQRLHLQKKRPKPKIERKDKATFEIGVGARTEEVGPLNTKSIAYAATRGIEEPTLKVARCLSTDTSIVFSHFDEDDKPVLFKCWSCDGKKRIYTNNDCIPVLFGKHMVDPIKTGSAIIICEGQWDALTWQQLGYPAVSIPSGVSNEEWIGEDWSFMNCFTSIFLDFDSDPAGQEAEQKIKHRLGAEKCRSISYRYKDANAAMMAGDSALLVEAYESARDAPIDKIVNPKSVKELVKLRLKSSYSSDGAPFFLDALNFHFRPYEITVWYGSTSHGKSSILQQQMAYNAANGRKSMISSFEQANTMTMSAMMRQYTSEKHIGDTEQFEEAYDALTGNVMFYDSMQRANPSEVVSTMMQAHRQLGVEDFVIDNVMTLEVDRQDNSKQAEAADMFRLFAAQNPVHLHLVMHPRKPNQGDANKPPGIADVMGAQEWSAMPHNVVCVWRDVAKAQKVNEMMDENFGEAAIEEFKQSCPDGKVYVRKQRETGDLPMTSYFYDPEVKRAYREQDDLVPYFLPSQEDQPTP
jgi:twinkle protein|tara:strand:+ start:8434 stop:10311 length:1878 start_codon:yes stop_codon:yes gene_type:complete